MTTETPIIKQIDPKLGHADQVGLRLRCDPAQAEAIHRGLRLVFSGRVSSLMPSSHSGFDFFVYVTADQTTLEQRWRDVLHRGGVTPTSAPTTQPSPTRSTSSPRAPAAAPGGPTAPRSSSPISQGFDLKGWERQFKVAVTRVRQDIPSGAVTVVIGPEWPNEVGGPTLSFEQEEQRLARSGLPAENMLRAQIALYARSGHYAQIVKLCRERRQEVLALPPSGLLIEQIVRAHQQIAQSPADDGLQAAAVDEAGRQIALAFLPELERLRQADGVRALLRAEPVPETGTLSEQLQGLVQLAPGERIAQLRDLHRSYPRASAVQIALADAHAALGETEQALLLYRNTPGDDQAIRDTAAARAAELLIGQGRHGEALALLPDRSDLPALLAGLRGAVLLFSGSIPAAQPLLRHAWEHGARAPVVAQAWARALVQGGQLEEAAEPYQLLLGLAPDTLSLEDWRTMTIIAMGGGFGDISNEQTAQYYDRYVRHAGRDLRNLPDAGDALWRRVDLRRAGENPAALLDAVADWLEWVAERGDREALSAALVQVAQLERAISREQRFALLEGIEPLVTDGALADVLVGEYVSIGMDEVTERLRKVQPLPVYLAHLRHALHFLDRTGGDMLAEEIARQRQALAERSLALPAREVEEEPSVSMAAVSLAIIGGHSATRREAERALRERHGLVHYAEVSPSSEEHVDRSRVLECVGACDLVAVITGYTGHDLTNHVRDLQREGKIPGRVLWLSCRGKSGVVREIIAAVSSASAA